MIRDHGEDVALSEGEHLDPIENYDGEIGRDWMDRRMAEAAPFAMDEDDPDEPEQWTRGWRLTDRRYVRCEMRYVKLLPPGRMISRPTPWPERLEDRPLLRNVSFERCVLAGRTWDATGAVLDEVTIDSVKAEIDLELCALRHVVIAGNLSKVRINWSSGARRMSGKPFVAKRTHQDRVDAQNTAFHSEADWILDISRGVAREWSIRDLPPDKVRVDPARQAFVSSASLEPARALLEAQPLEGICGSVVRSVLERDRGTASFLHVTPRSKALEEETGPARPARRGGPHPSHRAPSRSGRRLTHPRPVRCAATCGSTLEETTWT